MDRPTQYRLLESAPDGPFWQPGALSLSSDVRPRFRLLENAPPQAPLTQAQPKKPGFARKAWNATKYVAGLTKHLNPMDPGNSLETTGKALGWNEKTPWIDKAQDIVSLVGIVDPTGIADVSNALVYGARGKYGDAAISLAGAAVPYLGDVAKLGKFARGTAKAAEAGKAAARTERVAATAAKVDANAIKAARDASKGSRVERMARASVGRQIGRQGRTALKAATGTGKLRGKVGELDSELGRRFGDRYAQGKANLQSGLRQKAQGALDSVKGTMGPAQPEEKKQDVPAPGPEGRLARKEVGDNKPSHPTFTRKPTSGPTPPAASPKQEPTQAQPKTGGSAKTPRAGRPMAPVGGKCPTPNTKTSEWGAKDGFKRCHPQTPNRAH